VDVILDGPDSLTATLSNNSLMCYGEGNPRPKFHWIELNTVNAIFDGYELILCNSTAYERWKQTTSDNNLKLIFQCAATRNATVVKLNYSVSVNEIYRRCLTSGLASGKPMLMLFVVLLA
jgi:hypothetical protein